MNIYKCFAMHSDPLENNYYIRLLINPLQEGLAVLKEINQPAVTMSKKGYLCIMNILPLPSKTNTRSVSVFHIMPLKLHMLVVSSGMFVFGILEIHGLQVRSLTSLLSERGRSS